MHANLSWDSLIESVLQEIGKFGLDPATINHYRQTFKRLKQYAAAQNVEHYCDGLIRSFLHAIVGPSGAAARDGCSRPGHTLEAEGLLSLLASMRTIASSSSTSISWIIWETRSKSSFVK